jgi:NADH:ubiquinone oxidoreductase subunit 3 (subunit A)
LLSLGIPASLAVISFVFFPRNRLKGHKSSKFHGVKPNRTILGQRINVRFFLAANAALVLITLALELVPCATTLHSDNREGVIKGLIAVVTLAGFSVLGLLYSIRKGDMGWLSSFIVEAQKESYKEKKNG